MQRLVKHTDADHPDFALLQRAEREIHDLALRINNVERESDEQEGRQQMLRLPTFLGLFVTSVGDVGTLCQMTIVAGVAHVVAIQSNCGIGMSEIACYGLVVVHGSRKKLLTEEQIWVDGYQL